MVISNLFGHGAEEVADTLLMFHVNLKVADQHQAAVSADALLAAAEFA